VDWPFQQTAPRSSGLDGPVFHWQSFDFGKLPSERLRIEINGPLWIVRMYLEVNVSGVHGRIFPDLRCSWQIIH
jgi:hypothetical protein